MKFFAVSFKTSQFAYYVWANNETMAIDLVLKARPEFERKDLEQVKEIEQKYEIVLVSRKENVF